MEIYILHGSEAGMEKVESPTVWRDACDQSSCANLKINILPMRLEGSLFINCNFHALQTLCQ